MSRITGRDFLQKLKISSVSLFWMVMLVSAAMADDLYDKPPGFQFIIGPRLGINYTNLTPDEFSEVVNEVFNDNEEYFPLTSVFGVIFEQRILLGNTESHFAFQEVIMLNGLEQSIFLPSGSFLIGFRAASGFEVGAGATVSLSGVGVMVAAGWTFTTSGVYIPVDLSMVIPNKQRPMSIALTTGFNFLIRSRK